MAWWEDRAKVREVMEIERIMSAIQADIATAEIRHDADEVLRLFDLKVVVARRRNELIQEGQR